MNNRIDLTLYEGHTKGDKHNPDSWRVVGDYCEHGDNFVMNGPSPSPRYIGYIRHSNFAPDIPAKRESLSLADANLIADGPLLLAELKRCYEKIDTFIAALETIAGDLVYASSGEDVARIAEYADEMSGLI